MSKASLDGSFITNSRMQQVGTKLLSDSLNTGSSPKSGIPVLALKQVSGGKKSLNLSALSGVKRLSKKLVQDESVADHAKLVNSTLEKIAPKVMKFERQLKEIRHELGE